MVANYSTSSTTPIFTPPARLVPTVSENYPFDDLSDDETALLKEFRASHLASILAGLSGEPLDNEGEWTNDECLLLFLKATKWDLEASVKRLAATMQWRREFRPTIPIPGVMEPQCKIADQVLTGFDKRGRPVMLNKTKFGYLHKDHEGSVRFSVYLVERAIALMPRGVTKLTVVTDFEGSSMFNGFSHNVYVKFLSILSTHYPERLGVAICIRPTWYLSALSTLIFPFMDPVTKRKLVFVKDASQDSTGKNVTAPTTNEETGGWHDSILEFIDPDMLIRAYGGDHDFVFEHDAYWKALTEFKRV
ncbi:CRAL-TRIO domain-containing protein [Chytriomyces sp. MP71]|nr:CRAL-TRIO domain-containing protein [Chytriomyces sp. MP71]